MTAETPTERSAGASSWLAIALAAVVALPAAVGSGLIGTVHHALQPAHIAVWLPGGAS
jgi:hypothetical protein